MKTDETNIPTKQNSPKKIARLPCTYEDSGWTQSNQPQTKSWKTQTRSLSRTRYRFTKDVRLKSRGEFQKVHREGKRLIGRFLCIDYKKAPLLKLGISASKKYGSSPERNRFKRLVREAFRLNYHTLPSVEINVIPRQNAKIAKYLDISTEIQKLLR